MAIRSCQVWFVEKFENNVAVLLFAGCKEGCHDALDKTNAFFFLSAKAGILPEHSLATAALPAVLFVGSIPSERKRSKYQLRRIFARFLHP